ncbi:hypothetical protein N7541_004194 [Penicillium brevicompactum]|uniref:Translation initiation factor eIF2B subunit beta n=1 Tax=Penicillium brevicompactum TaxID=5074 RepID=A0A9W9RN94_PENBR|nr:hypothetical protein N7541_004194 [Penicillium brevicompactum]
MVQDLTDTAQIPTSRFLMPSTSLALTPGLGSFLQCLKTNPIDTSIETLISLLKRRQIRHSRSCATATACLLRGVITSCRTNDSAKLIERVQNVGRRLMAAQPREMVVGNIVRRVLGLIRDEAEDDREAEFALGEVGSESQPQTPRAYDDPSLPLDRDSPSLRDDRTTRPPLTSMFSLLSQPEPENSLPSTPGSVSPGGRLFSHGSSKDVRSEVIEGIKEIIDELGQVDDQIAAYALDHIHSNEIILTHTSSTTVQKFLLKAAAKRKFTVIHAESFPNNHESVHATVSGASINEDDNLGVEAFQKPLIEHGITVILIPDSAVFALMSRVNKVILGTHSVLANGGLIAAAGTRVIARAAKVHQTPVVVVSGVYKLSPVYPFDFDSLIEYGDPSKVLAYEDGDLVDQIDVQNPIYDYVPAELVDLYITNLGGHAPSYLYRIVSDHYRKEDISF